MKKDCLFIQRQQTLAIFNGNTCTNIQNQPDKKIVKQTKQSAVYSFLLKTIHCNIGNFCTNADYKIGLSFIVKNIPHLKFWFVTTTEFKSCFFEVVRAM